jgi:cold shock CspA family protein
LSTSAEPGESLESFDEIVSVGTRSSRLGTVQAFDPARGLGLVSGLDGAVFNFHSTAIVGGSRNIAVGAVVVFTVVAAPTGRYEASCLRTVETLTQR